MYNGPLSDSDLSPPNGHNFIRLSILVETEMSAVRY